MKALRSIFILLIIVLFGGVLYRSAASPAGTYRIDAKQSRFDVQVGTSGVFGFMGHSHRFVIRQFSGEIKASPESPESSSVEIHAVAESLEETGKFSEKDLNKINTDLRTDVLETSKFPEIVFKSTSVSASKGKEGAYQVQILGDLTLHGVTRQVTIPATVTLNGNTLRVVGQFEVRRENFDLKTESAGGGTVKVAQKMEISFELVGQS
jgi:polyisoprenoid-binding protein YceI